MTAVSFKQWAEYSAGARQRAASDPALIPHGTRNGRQYWGCGCESCREAARISHAQKRARRKAKSGQPLSDFDREILADAGRPS